jgi:hypothetical protein
VIHKRCTKIASEPKNGLTETIIPRPLSEFYLANHCRGYTRHAAIRPNKPDPVRRTISVQYWPWQFPDKIACPAAFLNALQAKNFRFCAFWEIAMGVDPGGRPVTRHIRSSDPRILTRKCCDRFPVRRCVGTYWVVSQRALCSPVKESANSWSFPGSLHFRKALEHCLKSMPSVLGDAVTTSELRLTIAQAAATPA